MEKITDDICDDCMAEIMGVIDNPTIVKELDDYRAT